MTTELATVSGGAGLAVRGSRPVLMREALKEETEQRSILAEYVRANMVEGVDFGTIPGTDRKSLLKPGGEKILSLFRCSARFIMEKSAEVFADPNEPKVRPFFFYRFKCEVISNDTGSVVAEGYGSASSHESKYRYRYEDKACPVCGKATILKSKYPPKGAPHGTPPGWYCYSKKGGCGTNFPAGTPEIENQQTGKVENPDAADQQNTVLKMGVKRSLVDAALRVGLCSDLFTQDAEDHAPAVDADVKPVPGGRANKDQSAKTRNLAAGDLAAALSIDRLKEVWSLITKDWQGGNGTTFTEEDFNALTALKDKQKEKLAAAPQQPAAAAAVPGGAAGNVRDGVLKKLAERGEKLPKDYKTTLDEWLSDYVHDGLTFDKLKEDVQGFDGNKVAMILGELNDWLDKEIPF